MVPVYGGLIKNLHPLKKQVVSPASLVPTLAYTTISFLDRCTLARSISSKRFKGENQLFEKLTYFFTNYGVLLKRESELTSKTHLIPRSMCSWMPKPKLPLAEKFSFLSSYSLTLKPRSRISSALAPLHKQKFPQTWGLTINLPHFTRKVIQLFVQIDPIIMVFWFKKSSIWNLHLDQISYIIPVSSMD